MKLFPERDKLFLISLIGDLCPVFFMENSMEVKRKFKSNLCHHHALVRQLKSWITL